MSLFTRRSHENLYPLIKCNTNANVCSLCKCPSCACVCARVSVPVYTPPERESVCVCAEEGKSTDVINCHWDQLNGKWHESHQLEVACERGEEREERKVSGLIACEYSVVVEDK